MRKKRRPKSPPFVMIEQAMLASKAWQQIGNAARVAYIHIRSKFYSPPTGERELWYSEMEVIMDHKTFAKAITQLEANGFIERTQRGGLFRRRNKFRIIDGWKSIRGEIPPVGKESSRGEIPLVEGFSRGEIPLIQGEKFPLLGKLN
jgi:hypothetical protein